MTHPSVAGAAVMAGLLVAGGGYVARHDLGMGNGLSASAQARIRLEQELPLGHARYHHHPRHLLAWHSPHIPKIHVQRNAPAVVASTVPYTVSAPVAAAPAPAPTSAAAPVTRTSPVGGGDDGGGDD
jgi:hypothetical protein